MDDSIGWTVVAIPAQDDPVWKVSSEKVPHMTILFLGDQSFNPNGKDIIDYVQHAARGIKRFGASVDYRGPLGPNQADVLFFENLFLDPIKEFRSNLLKDNNVFTAYSSVDQYPNWTPHLTLGYPDSPAKASEYPISYIQFDRLAIWTEDSEGVEFRLDSGLELEMSDVIDTDDFLQHYGVVGMKWGKRKGGLGARIKGAALDSNQQKTAVAQRGASGKHTLEEKIVNGPARVLMGKKQYQKMAGMEVSRLKEQTARIQSGKTTLLDKMEIAGRVSIFDLAVSRQDNKG